MKLKLLDIILVKIHDLRNNNIFLLIKLIIYKITEPIPTYYKTIITFY